MHICQDEIVTLMNLLEHIPRYARMCWCFLCQALRRP